jgi:paraquat-inducible protein B
MPREDIMEKLVEQGLRAQLESGNLLTGQLFVALDFHPEAPPAQMIYGGKYPELPTIPTPVEEIRATLTHLLKTFQKLPLEEAGEDLRQTILDLRNVLAESRQIVQRLNTEAVPSASATLTKLQALVSRLGAEVAPAMGDTLHQTRQTLAEAEKVLEGGAPLRTEVQRTLQEFASTARAFRQLADYLERHPEALLQGKGGKR